MFGEVMGKTKSQLRREILKMRLRQLTRHVPAIAGAVGTIVATAIALKYKNQVPAISVEEGWTNIPIPQHMMDSLENGHTLHYRQIRLGDEDCYSQYSMSKKSLGFSPEMDESFEEAKKERDNA